MKKKTINIVSHYGSIYGGNFIPSILDLCMTLKSDYNIVLSFPLEAKSRYWINYLLSLGIDIRFFRTGSPFQTIKDIKKINKTDNVDVVYTHFISPLLIKLACLFSKKIKLVIHIHSDFTGGKKEGALKRTKSYIADHLLRKGAYYIFVSEQMYTHFKLNKSIYLPNAYSPNRIPCNKFNIDCFKKKHNIASNDVILLFFGWSPYVKGADIVINAFLNSKQSNKKLIVVHKRGNGKEIIDNYLKDKVPGEYKHNNNIIFLPPQEDSQSLFEMSDVFISASRSEGFSYSILEAMINGDVILMSDISGTKWALKYDYVYDYQVEDYKLLAKLIDNVKSPYQNKIESRKNKLLKEYNIDKWADTIKLILKNL